MKNWEIKPNGADVIATNSSTGEVFSGTRDQLNVKLASVHRDSYSRTLVYSDATRQLSSDSASAVTYTIPLDSEFNDLQAGSTLTAYQAGTGSVSFTAGPGVTLTGVAVSTGRYQSVEVQYIGVNSWAVVNKITAALDANNNFTGLVGSWGVAGLPAMHTVDARRYGIFGDNQDYSVEMQAAIDDLDSQYLAIDSGMLVLALPAGTIRVSTPLIWKRCGIAAAIPNAGTRILWDGAAGATVLSADTTNFNSSFGLLHGVNFRDGTATPATWVDFTTFAGSSPTIDVFLRLSECHFKGSTSHAIKVAGWINCHWDHLRFDHTGGYAIHLAPGVAQNLSTFTLSNFTYDHQRTTSKGYGVIGVDNRAGASNIGTVHLEHGRIEINSAWEPLAALGSGGSTRAIFAEILDNVTPQARSIGWSLNDVTYADATGMGDDVIVRRDTSAATSDSSPSLIYSNIRTSNLSAVFGGSVGTRLAAVPVTDVAGSGAINGSSTASTTFGTASRLIGSSATPEAVTTAVRGCMATNINSGVGTGLYVKELNETNLGWSRVETAYIQTITYAGSITPAHNSGNVAVVALTGNMTVNTMSSSSVYVAGMRFRFMLSTDASARTITWNATWKGATLTTASAANQKAIVEFTYDGASWVQTMSTGWYS